MAHDPRMKPIPEGQRSALLASDAPVSERDFPLAAWLQLGPVLTSIQRERAEQGSDVDEHVMFQHSCLIRCHRELRFRSCNGTYE